MRRQAGPAIDTMLRGLAAGLAGTTCMTLTLWAEKRARKGLTRPVDYDASSHVVTAASTVLHWTPATQRQRRALFLLVHWGYGSATGMILDAPGSCLVTSIRPDILQISVTARTKIGPVGVIAADGSVAGIPEMVKWSLIIGSRDGAVATARATVLSSGSSSGVEHASFWEDWTQKVVKALLHAADWAELGIDDLWRWSQSTPAARTAVEILEQLEGDRSNVGRVEPGWAATLASVVDGEEKFHGNVWPALPRHSPASTSGRCAAALTRPLASNSIRLASWPATALCTCWRRRTTQHPGCCSASSMTSSVWARRSPTTRPTPDWTRL